MYGYPCARRAFSFFILMLALVLSGTGAAAAELSRPTFDPLREKAPMNNDGFRIIARGDAAVPPLTPREADIILRKATEAPWSGEYEKNTAAGTYLCRQCGVALYRSSDKFDSGCGWPAFDDALPGMVRRQPDADGPGHDGNLFAWLPHKPSRPQSRQRPEVGRGRCRSGATKKAPGERGPCEKLEVEQLLAIEGVDYATDGQHNHENRRCCHDAHAHASLLTMAIMSRLGLIDIQGAQCGNASSLK